MNRDGTIIQDYFMMLKRGGVRLLTSGEIFLAREFFGYSIQYNRVWIHNGSYLPFGLQEDNTAMTPNGEMWFESRVYYDDYSRAPVDFQHMFIHEMMHVWQYQRGMNIRFRGLLSWAANYKYDLSEAALNRYSMEQQASIVADYWLLIKHGFKGKLNIINLKSYYEYDDINSIHNAYVKILKGFPG